MNEAQIIEQQIATERLHFSEVANACTGAIDHAAFATNVGFARACAEYFAFALQRLGPESSPEAAARLQAARTTQGVESDSRWREFLRLFNDDCRQHFEQLDAQLTPNTSLTKWRAISGIDADSMFEERTRYEKVQATLPTGIALAALAAFLP